MKISELLHKAYCYQNGEDEDEGMTNEEAVRILRNNMFNANKRIYEAVSMAIEALKAQDVPDTNVGDMISRQDAIGALDISTEFIKRVLAENIVRSEREKYSWGLGLIEACIADLKELPSAEPELYGYKIEHLALIARVMQKEGVTPEKAVQTFVDMKRIIEMLIEEIQKKVERAMMEVEHDKS